MTWRMREDEAVVLVGTTPPSASYVSFDLTMVKGSLHTGPVVWPAVGDPVDSATIHTNGSDPYNRPFALVITGHERTRAKVHEMLAASAPGGAISDLTIPPALFHLGIGKDADQLPLGIRINAPKPGFEKAVDTYRATPPLSLLRVPPKRPSGDPTKPEYPPAPLPVPPLRVSGTGATELSLNPTYRTLRRRIKAGTKTGAKSEPEARSKSETKPQSKSETQSGSK
ncbi:hypothetical protein ACIRJO_29225 [Streptomyces sp. NPDC102394]|uniref:hypothetical protein n=1 Tax=Streptomyces sp. NPDC102394 TaxID=3366167 RepID=UPI003820AB26